MKTLTYVQKLKELRRQRSLYDDFLKECTGYHMRLCLISEIARIGILIKNIEAKPISKNAEDYPEYPIEIPSVINK